jgi:N-acetylmuramoyl-L-alanine amidase
VKRKTWIGWFLFLTGIMMFTLVAYGREPDRLVTVTAYDVNIRAEASTDSPCIGKANYGDSFPVVQSESGWYKIQYAEGKTGWIHSSLVQEGTNANSSADPMTEVVEAATPDLHVRAGASTSYDVIASIDPGATYPLVQYSGDWIQIRLPGERTGWVARWLVHVTKEPAQKAALGEKGKAVVNADVLNVRESPSPNATLVGTLEKNRILDVLESREGWVRISAGSLTGWVASDYLLSGNPPATEAKAGSSSPETGEGTVVITQESVLRNGPGTQYEAIGLAHPPQSFPVVEQSGQWYKIKLANDAYAWIAGWIVQVKKPPRDQQPPSLDGLLRGKTIVIDPGHGGLDVGAVGSHLGVYEKNLTLSLSRILYNKLLSTGAKVILTRDGDTYVSLGKRVAIAEEEQADLFLSIHFNTNEDPALRGSTVYYYSPNGKDREIAEQVAARLARDLPIPCLGARFGDYYVLRENAQTAILVETAFLSSEEDERLASESDFQEKVAESLFQSLLSFLK